MSTYRLHEKPKHKRNEWQKCCDELMNTHLELMCFFLCNITKQELIRFNINELDIQNWSLNRKMCSLKPMIQLKSRSQKNISAFNVFRHFSNCNQINKPKWLWIVHHRLFRSNNTKCYRLPYHTTKIITNQKQIIETHTHTHTNKRKTTNESEHCIYTEASNEENYVIKN